MSGNASGYNALGYIEAIGLAAAVEAADTAVKAANVKLIGYELAKGDGMITVKVEGDVGAVKAAVSSAAASAGKIGTVVSTHIIPRPAEGTEKITRNRDTVGLAKDSGPKRAAPSEPPPPPESPEPPASAKEAASAKESATEGEGKKRNQSKKGSGKQGEPELDMP